MYSPSLSLSLTLSLFVSFHAVVVVSQLEIPEIPRIILSRRYIRYIHAHRFRRILSLGGIYILREGGSSFSLVGTKRMTCVRKSADFRPVDSERGFKHLSLSLMPRRIYSAMAISTDCSIAIANSIQHVYKANVTITKDRRFGNE